MNEIKLKAHVYTHTLKKWDKNYKEIIHIR